MYHLFLWASHCRLQAVSFSETILKIASYLHILVKHPRSGLPPTVLYNLSYLHYITLPHSRMLLQELTVSMQFIYYPPSIIFLVKCLWFTRLRFVGAVEMTIISKSSSTIYLKGVVEFRTKDRKKETAGGKGRQKRMMLCNRKNSRKQNGYRKEVLLPLPIFLPRPIRGSTTSFKVNR